ncbi:hypothetical protein CUJ83_12865 [Methanocella sp. CWC-04]|uniref:DUF1622 domain-containing protein n=1 Tax=Methanooceanicella nereidis TaxID=2052831 RepID=A0AAP2W711_9EURY|nr:DUF1622 domain-containing protein [Methanocella sp. CWC-04]MCD1295887.1 hypothetical protein [Methanocella sp. CWC-04]
MIDVEYYIINGALWIKQIAELISIILIAAGIIVASYKILQIIRSPSLKSYNLARLAFSRYLVLALEFMLAADILVTAIEPTWEDLGMLAAIAAIRTFLNFFLQREMKEEEMAVEKSA